MFVIFFYILNVLLLLSGLLAIRLKSSDRRFSLSLAQALLHLPLLAGEYFYLALHLEGQAVQVVLFSEIVFLLIWFSMALRLPGEVSVMVGGARFNSLMGTIVGAVLTIVPVYFLLHRPAIEISHDVTLFHIYSLVYFSALLILMTVLYTVWRLDRFWRTLNAAGRREYKFLAVGSHLICGSLAWSASHRLIYLSIVPGHLMLLTALLLLGWILIFCAVVYHRLLNRKIFVSRKVVYSLVLPCLLAVYFLGLAMISLIMGNFGLQLPFVAKGLLITLGFVAVGLFAFSGKMRRQFHFFISTHFYINKYEYRDEWLALSQHLQGALTEAHVVKALARVLAQSLYTSEIFIWLGNSPQGYRLVSSPETSDIGSSEMAIALNDPLVEFITTHSHFHVKEKEPGMAWHKVFKSKRDLLASLNLVLIAPISIGNQLVGLIGLGPEFTSGEYGYDDFDLLTVLGSQTASALLAVRMAEELAHAREQQAWHRLSAFVLHDIKNAATMLSLLRENAPEHIHEPEFQQDMLELVDDASRRMGRVEQRLGTLKSEIAPVVQNLELGRFLRDCCRRLEKKLVSMEINIGCSGEVRVMTDPELLCSMLENLLLNAFEAQPEGTVVQIRTGVHDDGAQAVIEIVDNGPGIPEDLLPDLLFEPFKSTKEGGSGIGLWQVKRVTTALGGHVTVKNSSLGGAWFVVRLPLAPSGG